MDAAQLDGRQISEPLADDMEFFELLAETGDGSPMTTAAAVGDHLGSASREPRMNSVPEGSHESILANSSR